MHINKNNHQVETSKANAKGRLIVWVCITLLLSFFILAGCTNQDKSDSEVISLSTIETKQFLHDKNGMALTIPKDWKTISKTDASAIFSNATDSISMTTAWEVGGMAYYSYNELEAAAGKILNDTLTNVEILNQDVYKGLENAVKVVATGNIGDERNSAVADVLIISPLNGIRYYIVTICGVDEYKEYNVLFNDIYKSFYVGKPEDFLYEQIEDRRLKEEQAKEELEEEKTE